MNAPTRPPTHRSKRRPPKGPIHVPRTPSTAAAQQLRDDLTTAATALRKAGEKNLAQAVDKVLAPHGWVLLRAGESLSKADSDDEGESNVPVRMSLTDRDRAKALAEQAGETLTGIAEQGFRDFLDGTFVPMVRRAGRKTVSNVAKVSLNLRPDVDLANAVRAKCKAMNEAGHHPKIAISNVARAAIEARYQIGLYAPEDEPAQ